MFMSRFMDWVHNKAEGKDSHEVLNGLEVLRRLLLGVTISVLILSTTYSSVFFMKGELLWGSVYGLIMMLSGWCVFKLCKCGGFSR